MTWDQLPTPAKREVIELLVRHQGMIRKKGPAFTEGRPGELDVSTHGNRISAFDAAIEKLSGAS